MLVSIDLFVLVPFIFITFVAIGGMAMFFFDFKRYAPEAFIFRSARKARKGITCVHYANGMYEYINPRFDNDATDGYYSIKKGKYKFKDMSGEKSDRLGGDLSVLHVFDGLLEPVSVVMCAHMDALADTLRRLGYDIRGVEKIFFYVLGEAFRKQKNVKIHKPWTAMNLDEQSEEIIARTESTLTEIDVTDEATRGKIREIMKYIMAHKDELEKAVSHIQPRPFSFQTAIRAVDNLVAFTSANYYNTKNQVEAFARSERKGSDYQVFLYVGIAALAICGGIYLLTK
jgi:hypothetical protein